MATTKPVIPAPVKYRRSAITLPDALWVRVEKAAERDNKGRASPDRISRDRYVEILLGWALDQRENDLAEERRLAQQPEQT